MTHGLAAARRFALFFATLLLLTIAPLTPAATAESASPYLTLGHAWMSVNTNLRAASHISAWSIDEYLANNTSLPPLGRAFKAAEAKYDVNALYLLAHAMHETAFGTSYIGQRFHNLFGWNAYDRDPTGMASRFPTYSASIDYVASQISALYLSPTGKFFGGAPTLRGMYHYASDPMWGQLIARIANGIILPTLAKRGIAMDDPIVSDANAGKPVTITLTTRAGRLPDGLEAGYRFVPVAVVEAGPMTGGVPPADPTFRRAIGEAADDTLRITVTAPTRPGRYRLELQLRDSDGSVLTEFGVPSVPDAAVRVYGADAVGYDLSEDAGKLSVRVSNEGRQLIPALSTIAGAAPGSAPTATPTILHAWLIDSSGTPTLLADMPLNRNLKPGAVWATDLPSPDPAALPAILVLRLETAGAPERLGGSPPGVFRLAADGSASPVADPAAAAAGVTATEAPRSPAAALTPAVPLEIGALTPVDAATRMLLNPEWKPAAAPKSGVNGATPTKAGVIRLTYQALVSPKHAGTATIRVTNGGTAPLLTALPALATDSTASATSATGSDDTSGTNDDIVSSAILLVTAVPAWGPATEPVVLRVPLLIDVDPGTSLDVGFSLPATATGQSSYLIVARVLPADGGPAYAPTLFWLRSAAPSASNLATATPTATATAATPTATATATATTPTATTAATTTATATATASATATATAGPAPTSGDPAAPVGPNDAGNPAVTSNVVPLSLIPILQSAGPPRVGSK